MNHLVKHATHQLSTGEVDHILTFAEMPAAYAEAMYFLSILRHYLAKDTSPTRIGMAHRSYRIESMLYWLITHDIIGADPNTDHVFVSETRDIVISFTAPMEYNVDHLIELIDDTLDTYVYRFKPMRLPVPTA